MKLLETPWLCWYEDDWTFESPTKRGLGFCWEELYFVFTIPGYDLGNPPKDCEIKLVAYDEPGPHRQEVDIYRVMHGGEARIGNEEYLLLSTVDGFLRRHLDFDRDNKFIYVECWYRKVI